MNILCIGDVFGEAGCRALMKALPAFKRENKIDFVIANGENSALGNGITRDSARMLLNCGVDVITGGNHSLRREEINDMLEECSALIRPANLLNVYSGNGIALVDLGFVSIAVINIMGSVYLENVSDPFDKIDDLVQQAKDSGSKIIIVDFHAEATSEKKAMGYYLDGRVSAVFGTHTHIATADEQILPKGTGYITDLGMSGVQDSVLGVEKEIIVARFKGDTTRRFIAAEGEGEINGCIFEIDNSTGLCKGVKRVKFW